MVGYDPDQELALAGGPCENGHAQERSLLATVEAHLAADQVWGMARNFCGLHGLQRIAAHPA